MQSIKKKEENTERVLKKKFDDNLNKIEENNEKLMLKQDALKQLERLNANKREKTLRWIINKGDRIEKFKLQQQILSERKRKVKDEIVKKKAEYEYQFQKMFHKKNLDQKMINDIHKMFPDNEKINYLLQRLIELDEDEKNDLILQEQQRKEMDKMLKTTELELKKTFSTGHNNNNYNKTTSKYTEQFFNSDNVILEENTKNANSEDNLNSSENYLDNKNSFSNKKKLKNKNNKLKDFYDENKTKNSENLNQISTNQKTEKNTKNKNYNKKEKEIQEKLENYKQKLSNELLELISNEKKKEAERIEFYNMANNKEKEILFKQLGEERAKSALLIVKKNEEIVKKYKDYENKLRENYN